MKKSIIQIPKGIRYIGEPGSNYRLEDYDFPHILNKSLTGCGFTELCIRNDQDLILCSPRKILLENKNDQHLGEVHLVVNEEAKSVDFEKDITKVGTVPVSNRYFNRLIAEIEQANNPIDTTLSDRVLVLRDKVLDYYNKCKIGGKKCKILVTYDSFRHVKEALGKYMDRFQVVVDEFQSIFIDSKFKPTTEVEFMSCLEGINKLCYVSATPMMEKYLDQLDEFKDLPYIEMDWETLEPGRVMRPGVESIPIKTSTITPELNKLIERYLAGNFEKHIYKDENGNFKEKISKEAVIYVNSVNHIANAIKKHGLTLDNTNVLCARTHSNAETIRKAFKGKKSDGIDYLGKVPKKGEPHKMFTFCTRTVYLGADFYSECASSYIFSDANIDSLVVDISMDLNQIIGRQRLVGINPWARKAKLFFISGIGKIPEELFQKLIDSKIERTTHLIDLWTNNERERGSLIYEVELAARTFFYKTQYVAINRRASRVPFPVFNNLALVSEKRAFEIFQIDYADRFSVMREVGESVNGEIRKADLKKISQEFNDISLFQERMKFLFGIEKELADYEMRDLLSCLPGKYGNYVVLGEDFCKSVGYQESKIRANFEKRFLGFDKDEIIKKLTERGVVADKRITCSELKEALKEVYKEVGCKDSVKATDIEKFFEAKPVKVTVDTKGRRLSGYLIIGPKN